jgi:hypothetical protein
MSRRIEIEFEGAGRTEIEGELQRVLGSDVKFETPDLASSVRSPDLLVALVGTGGVAIGALLKGLFDFAVAKGAAKIVLKAANGSSLEAPANLSEQRFAHLLKELHTLNLKRVQIL